MWDSHHWGDYMAIFTVNNSNNRFTLKLTLTEGAYNTADNTSPITYKLELVANTANNFTQFGIGRKIVLGGVTVFEGARKTGEFSIADYGTLTLAAGTCTITHDPDGRKNLSVEYSIDMAEYSYTAGYLRGTGTMELVPIPRYVILKSASNFTDEENPSIVYSNVVGEGVTSLQACVSLDLGGTDPIIPYREIPIDGTSYQFVLSEEERTMLRNACTEDSSMFVFYILKTVVGGTTHTTRLHKVMTIVNADPVFNDGQVDYADSNTDVVNVTGDPKHIVQSHSILNVTYGAAVGVKGADIERYIIEVNGSTFTTAMYGTLNLGAVNSSTDVTLSVTAVDSRGFRTTVNKTVAVLPWSVPVLTATAGRETTFDEEVTVKAEATISSVNEKNTATVTCKYKTVGGEYGEEVQIPNGVKYGIECNPAFAYIFCVTVTDAFGGTAYKELDIEKGILPLFIDTEKNAVGINTFPEKGEAFRVADGLAVFDDGIVLKTATKSFKITVNDSGALVIEEMK